jgi:tRNA pseudouridine38/39 synthase
MMAVLFLIGKGIEQKSVIPDLFNKLDGKPNYQMAPDYPLVLYNCEFERELWKPTLESHTSFIQGVYENLRENLSKKYIEFLHFY